MSPVDPGASRRYRHSLNQSQPQASYQHDFLGRRVVKSVPGTPTITRHFQYDRAGHLLAESDGQGNAQAEYIWLDDIPVALVTGGALSFIHPIHFGSPQMLITNAWAQR